MSLILDASALIAYLKPEMGGEMVDSLIADPSNTCCVHALNMSEVYYEFLRIRGKSEAEIVVMDLIGAGVTIREDMDGAFWREVGTLKADLKRVSLADCCCATLAIRIDGDVVTTDRDFARIAKRGICRVRFIR